MAAGSRPRIFDARGVASIGTDRINNSIRFGQFELLSVTYKTNTQKKAEMRWSNESVRKFAFDNDPVKVMEEHVRELVLWAMDKGWSGPPFDPLWLADILNIPVVPNAAIRDARTVPLGKNRFKIEFNPTRPRGRVRFSVAHEIAHTFFPDCAETVRHRHESRIAEQGIWQLEMLCNIGAAELIMPIGSLKKEMSRDLGIAEVLDLRKKYDVSTEALLIRIAKATDSEWAAFCASKGSSAAETNHYLIDYVIPSRSWRGTIGGGSNVPENSVVEECTAIGFTANGIERWGEPLTRVNIECVGLPSYPGAISTRVAGLLKRTSRALSSRPRIKYIYGDALNPRGKGRQVIAQIVNDATPNWGGGGFASAVKRKWPDVQHKFRDWASPESGRFKIGNSAALSVSEEIEVFCMIAQRGYGYSETPRIRYVALEKCFRALAERTVALGGRVHMPRVGVGHAGGNWPVIEELINQELVNRGIEVTVYDLPTDKGSAVPAGFLAEFK